MRADRSENAETLVPVRAEDVPPEDTEDRDSPPPVNDRRSAPRYGELAGSVWADRGRGVYGHELMARGWLGLAGAEGVLVAEKYVEATVHVGADGMRGVEWTPAFGTGAEVRVFALRHLTAAGAGASFGRIDRASVLGASINRVRRACSARARRSWSGSAREPLRARSLSG